MPEESSVLPDLELDPDQRNSFEDNPALHVAVFGVVQNINFLAIKKRIFEMTFIQLKNMVFHGLDL